MKDGGLPDGWIWSKLSDLVDDPKKDIVDGPFGSNLKSDEYLESGIPVFKIQNIKANRFVNKRISYVSEEKAKSLIRHSFSAGDLIITKLGEPLGLCCKVPDKYPFGIIVADLMRLRPDKAKIVDQYLIYAINSEVIQKQFKDITKGTTRARVNLSIVRDIKVPHPNIAEQKRVVEKIDELLSELDKGIEQLQTLQQQLRVYKQAVLKHAFEGKLTEEWRKINPHSQSAQNLLSEIKVDQEKHIKPTGNKKKAYEPLMDNELAKLPEYWLWVKIDSLKSNEKHALKAGPFGSSLKKEFYKEAGYKIYGQEQVIAGDAGKGHYYIDGARFKTLESCKVQANDILISLVGTIGKVLILPEVLEEGIINPRIVKITLNKKFYLSKFFKYYFESSYLKNLYSIKSKGTTMDVLNLGIIQDLPFPLCSINEQAEVIKEIESRLSVCDKFEETIKDSLKQSEALRQSILKKAFNGDLIKV